MNHHPRALRAVLQGGFPEDWGNCTAGMQCMARLSSLQCTSCGLTGQLPGWQSLPSLRQLLLQHNAFSGALPVSFAWLPNLDTVDLSYNQMSEVPGSDYFSIYAKALKVLVLRGNALNSSLPGGEEDI
jgi:hypothetical protein